MQSIYYIWKQKKLLGERFSSFVIFYHLFYNNPHVNSQILWQPITILEQVQSRQTFYYEEWGVNTKWTLITFLNLLSLGISTINDGRLHTQNELTNKMKFLFIYFLCAFVCVHAHYCCGFGIFVLLALFAFLFWPLFLPFEFHFILFKERVREREYEIVWVGRIWKEWGKRKNMIKILYVKHKIDKRIVSFLLITQTVFKHSSFN